MSFRIKDKVWIQQSFLLPETALRTGDQRRRVMTSAAYKFTDTTIGGNFAINAPPQFTRFADIRVGGSEEYRSGARNTSGVRWMRSTGNWMAQGDHPNSAYTTPSAGMGRFYSEGIDDFGQDLVMRFGVPEYNSLTQFFLNFYSTDAALMARTGRTLDLFATAGRAVGFLLALPLQPVILGGQIVKFLGAWPASKYYYMKPTMYPYWTAVNTIVNGIAVNIGMIPQALTPTQAKTMGVDSNYLGNQQDVLNEYARVLPDVFLGGQQKSSANRPVMGLDVYAIANRAQRIANSYNEKIVNKIDNLRSADDLNSAMRQFRDDMFHRGGLGPVESGGIESYRKTYLAAERNRADAVSNYVKLDGTPAATATDDLQSPSGASVDEQISKDANVEVESVAPDGSRDWYNMADDTSGSTQNGSWFGSLRNMFEAERRDGAQYVTFRVSYSGTTGESFSSSVEESQISQKFNSASSSARSARFDWANGQLGLPGVDQVIGAVKSFVTGTLDGIQMSGLMALGGNAFVDIPKTWNGSTAQLPKAEYTIKLRSPYGSRMSRLMNLYIPLAMLLAGALPLSTGKRSYTSPFICEAFCRGRHAIRLGMIDSMSITRGTGNMGWNMDGDALGIDVTFSIVDMSTVMHLPIHTNFGYTDKFLQGAGDLLGGIGGQELAAYLQKGTYDDDNAFTDYLAVLGSLSWQDMIYANRRWRLARYRQMQNWSSWKSPARVASWMGHTQIGRLINAISTETDRPD